jgi:hypothetical protein
MGNKHVCKKKIKDKYKNFFEFFCNIIKKEKIKVFYLVEEKKEETSFIFF